MYLGAASDAISGRNFISAVPVRLPHVALRVRRRRACENFDARAHHERAIEPHTKLTDDVAAGGRWCAVRVTYKEGQ